MEIKLLNSKGNKLAMMIEGTSPAFVNALRRIMISEVPTMAIEDVEFHENTSALFDEIIAHRLGLIPLEFDPKKFNFSEDCTCKGKGCTLCQAVFTLEKQGPCVVHSGDLKPLSRTVRPTDPRFPIVELLEGQKIKLEAVARLGTGKEHIKWQAAVASYHYLPDLSEKKFSKACQNHKPLARGAEVTDASKCEICKMAEEISSRPEHYKNPAGFVFFVESVCGLKPSAIVSKAAEILRSKAEEFKKEVSKL